MDHTNNNDFGRSDADRAGRAEETVWAALGRLFLWRRFIIGVTGGVALAAVVITLLIPNWYVASARLLVPESGGGLSSALLKNLPSAAASLLGGGGGDYTRYMAILGSRTVKEAAVDSFNLIRIYDLEDSPRPLDDALRQLDENLSFEIDREYDYLSVSVADADPERAAAMANFFVRRLNDVNARLSAQNAGNYRRFIELRYREAQTDIDSVLKATEAFQREYGVYDLPAQTQSFFEQVGNLRAQAVQAEIQYEVLRQQYGPDNPRVDAAREYAQRANSKYREALGGREQLMPVPQAEVPEVARRYAELEMERTIQRAILELVGPLYEQARFQEEYEAEAVQVLDDATPPVRKSGPRRSIIVIAATLSAFLLAVVFVLLYTWWQRHHAYFAHRFRAATDAEAAAEAEVKAETKQQTPVT